MKRYRNVHLNTDDMIAEAAENKYQEAVAAAGEATVNPADAALDADIADLIAEEFVAVDAADIEDEE